MHTNALKQGELFFSTYCKNLPGPLKVVEIGSYDVNGSLRDVASKNIGEYVGLDFNPGPGVDIVLTDPYHFPYADNTFDVLVTSSCFEHSEMFWLTFLESLRILKPNGLLYLNSPGAWMSYHRFPVDCWRFYPDAAKGLETWAKYNNVPSMVLETYIATPTHEIEVADFVAVFLKDQSYQSLHPNRILDRISPYSDYLNGFRFPLTEKFSSGWDHQPAAFHNMHMHPKQK